MNARFWVWYGDSMVKLTLRPDQSVSHHRGGTHDEGWRRSGDVWTHDGDRVTWERYTDGTDCDGRHGSERVMYCPLGASLKAEEAGDGTRVPDWSEKTHRVHDASAAEAGVI